MLAINHVKRENKALLYMKFSSCVARMHCFYSIMNNTFILYREIMMVCFENYRELVSVMCDKNTEILILLSVHILTNEP
jgi:hypothetical protein